MVTSVADLGPTAVAIQQAGQASLATGANLATGLTGGAVAPVAAAITTATQGDIGALLANGSKFGPSLTAAWTSGSNTLSNLSSADLSGAASTALTNVQGAASTALTNAQGAAQTAVTGATGAAMGLLGKASQFATSLGSQLSGLVSGVQKAPAFTNTVDRATVDAAVTRVIGSDKIASPTYELPSADSLGISADIAQAKSLLAQAQTIGSNLLNQASTAVKNLFG